MNIELKKFKLIAGHDDDIPFMADLYVDGVLTAHLFNDGWGGGTNFQVVNKAKYDEVTALAKLQKDERFPDLELNLDCYLDKYINAEVARLEEKKNAAKIKRYFKDSIVIKKASGEVTYYKYKMTMAQMMSTSVGRSAIQNSVNKIKKESHGCQILNDNLVGINL